MSWQSQALGGPVLAWEIKRATRPKLWRSVQIGYCAWLVIQAPGAADDGLFARRTRAYNFKA